VSFLLDAEHSRRIGLEAGAYLISITAGAFFLFAGYRLLRLSVRTREHPERYLGLYFFFCGIYYFGYNVPSLFGSDAWSSPAQWVFEWCYAIGVVPFLFFIREVFRPRDAWASALVWLCVFLMAAGTGVGNLEDHANYTLENPAYVMEWFGYTIPCAWVAYEAARQHRSARKRVRIGLCEPLTANRLLLMAIFGVFETLACLAYLLYSFDLESHAIVSEISDALLGGTEFASAAVLWLAFFPPSFYKHWIRRRAVIGPTPMSD